MNPRSILSLVARGALLAAFSLIVGPPASARAEEARPWVAVRGVYGGVPQEVLDSGRGLREFGLDAVWLGSGSFTAERMARLRAQGVSVYAEFNTLHVAEYLKEHPDAAPVGADGKVQPPPDGWQGICPSHEAYRRSRVEAFRQLLRDFAVDGVWLDYHHAHASWEQAEPNLPDTCFCDRCLRRFQAETGVVLPDAGTAERARLLLTTHRERWVRWRCDLFTDWVRELRAVLDATRPGALLGTFHNPWTDEERGRARIEKLAIDLRAQAAYLDVFSPMPYHARFGHRDDPGWISRQVAWLGRHLGVEGRPGERHRIWPIVQLSDWGESVPLEQVAVALDHGSRRPATGVMAFAWGGLRAQPEKVEAMGRVYRAWSAGPPRSGRETEPPAQPILDGFELPGIALPDLRRDRRAGHAHDLVHHDLRDALEPRPRARRQREAEQGRVHAVRRDRAERDARVGRVEQIGLDDEGGAGLARVRSARRDDDDRAPLQRHPRVSAVASTNRSASRSDARPLTSRDCRRASRAGSSSAPALPKAACRTSRTTAPFGRRLRRASRAMRRSSSSGTRSVTTVDLARGMASPLATTQLHYSVQDVAPGSGRAAHAHGRPPGGESGQLACPSRPRS
jgi:hypothetical protein